MFFWSSFPKSPRYNRAGWLGVKHQFTYLHHSPMAAWCNNDHYILTLSTCPKHIPLIHPLAHAAPSPKGPLHCSGVWFHMFNIHSHHEQQKSPRQTTAYRQKYIYKSLASNKLTVTTQKGKAYIVQVTGRKFFLSNSSKSQEKRDEGHK